MSAFDKYPLGKPAFVTHILDRAAHLRSLQARVPVIEVLAEHGVDLNPRLPADAGAG
mgnify:CR=1 FL=1